jgi:DNA-binding XRE family transcriptional regulator
VSSVFDFSRHIRKLASEKKYQDALSYFKAYKNQFNHNAIASNEYLVSDMLSCLRHSNYLDAGFTFLKIYNVEINSNTKERILTAYGWLLWSKYKSDNLNQNNTEESNYSFEDEEEFSTDDNVHYEKNELIEKIELLLPLLLSINNNFSKTLVSNLFSIVLKIENNKPSPNWKLVNDFCDHFKPEQLSKDCSTIQVERKGQIREMELASDLENWYAYKTKALFKLSEWQKCLDLSKDALEALSKFHYSNDVWFLRRLALSRKKLGNSDDAIKELETILRKKREWFIQKELAELYFEKDDIEQAYKFSVDAINNFGPLEFKVDLLYLMGKIFQAKTEHDLALKHFSLSKIIRQNNSWKIPQKLIDELKQFNNNELQKVNSKNLEIELKKYWKSFAPIKQRINNSEKLQGTILRFLNNNERGKDGFLKCGNKEYYFSLSSNYHLTPQIDINSKVIFEVHTSSNGKKDYARINGVLV